VETLTRHGGRGPVSAARGEAEAYRAGEDRPLRGYLAIMAVFASLLAAVSALAAAAGRTLPSDVRAWDVILLTLGTHKLSRTLSKDAVTSPLRAPFTRYASSGGPAEVMEDARHDSALRHAIGELITCPFCLDMWVATGFTLGLAFAPRATRLIATIFAVLTGADLLQLGYTRAQQDL
jgi:hypothetical protein